MYKCLWDITVSQFLAQPTFSSQYFCFCFLASSEHTSGRNFQLLLVSLVLGSSKPSRSVISALSRMVRPSLYLWLSSVANSYIQPSLVSQFLQKTSRTMCRPVIIIRSWTSLYDKFTTYKDTDSYRHGDYKIYLSWTLAVSPNIQQNLTWAWIEILCECDWSFSCI